MISADLVASEGGADGDRNSRWELGLTPTDAMAGVLIRDTADSDGVANSIHDVLAIGRGRGIGTLGGKRLSDEVFRGRRWWAGKRRVGGVPGEGWDTVGRIRSVGRVHKRINGGRSVPRMML